MLEVEDINKIINDELIRHKLLTEDDPPIISIIADINTFKIIILVERGYKFHLDDNFAKMFGFSEKILKKDLQRSDLIPQINRINYLKIYSNIIDNKNNPYYLSNVFIKSNVSELTVYNENNKYKKQRIINDVFNYIEIEIFDEKNEKIEIIISTMLQHQHLIGAEEDASKVLKASPLNIRFRICVLFFSRDQNILEPEILGNRNINFN